MKNKGLLFYEDLIKLVENRVIDAPLENVNGASIDITLGRDFMVEVQRPKTINLAKRESIETSLVNTPTYTLAPGEAVLATTEQVFNLPDDIAILYVCKSTMARNFLNHLNAGFGDPGWVNSKLTLELVNQSRFHSVTLTEGMKIGQILFFRGSQVPSSSTYLSRGQYNNQLSVQGAKTLK